MIAQKLENGLTIAALISGVDELPFTCFENPVLRHFAFRVKLCYTLNGFFNKVEVPQRAWGDDQTGGAVQQTQCSLLPTGIKDGQRSIYF